MVYQALQKILADDTAVAKEIFERIDKNGDRILSKDEFTKGLEMLGFQASPGEIPSLCRLATDGNGVIDYSEILAETNSILTEPVQRWRKSKGLWNIFCYLRIRKQI